MNVKVLIDSIVHQTTVLIAQLATSAGLRAPLAHIANEVFLDLVRELEAQGVNRKVAADMFGLALRSYQYKVRRLTESATERDQSLWEAVLAFVRVRGQVSRADILRRFYHDDERVLSGILGDQVESGLLFTAGRGGAAVYRVTSEEEIRNALDTDDPEALDTLVWMGVYRLGPATPEALAAGLALPAQDVEASLERLLGEGRVQRLPDADPRAYFAEACILPLGTQAGWEAAVFDHYQALVRTIAAKLDQGAAPTRAQDEVGGSTYSFDIWPGHPFEGRVRGLLRELRRELSALRVDVTAFDDAHRCPDDELTRVVFYLGQTVHAQPTFDGDTAEVHA